ETHGEKKSPDGKQGADVLRMLEAGKGKFTYPTGPVAELVAVKDADFAQSVENAEVENLTEADERRAEGKRQRALAGWHQRAATVKPAPTEKHAALENFEAAEKRP